MTSFKLTKSHHREGERYNRRSEQGRGFLGEHLVQQSRYVDGKTKAQRWEALGSWNQLVAELVAELESTVSDSQAGVCPAPCTD